VVHVEDKSEKPVTSLGPANFRGEIGGKPLRVLSAEPDTQPHRVLVLIHAGTSIRRLEGLENAWKVARELIQTLGQQHSLSIWTLSHQLSRYADFTTDQQILQRALELAEAQTSKERPGLFQLRYPLLQLAQQFPHAEPGDVLCVITGYPSLWYDPDLYEEVVEGIRDEFARRGLRLSVIVVDQNPYGSGDYRAESAVVAAEATGGGWAVLRPGTIARNQYHQVLSQWYKEILQTYRLEIELPEPCTKPRKWKLEVVDEAGKKMRGLRITHPKVCVPVQESP